LLDNRTLTIMEQNIELSKPPVNIIISKRKGKAKSIRTDTTSAIVTPPPQIQPVQAPMPQEPVAPAPAPEPIRKRPAPRPKRNVVVHNDVSQEQPSVPATPQPVPVEANPSGSLNPSVAVAPKPKAARRPKALAIPSSMVETNADQVLMSKIRDLEMQIANKQSQRANTALMNKLNALEAQLNALSEPMPPTSRMPTGMRIARPNRKEPVKMSLEQISKLIPDTEQTPTFLPAHKLMSSFGF